MNGDFWPLAIVVSVLLALYFVCDYLRGRADVREDKDLAEDIKHLPSDVQADIWAAHLRQRADRDLRS